MYNDETLLETLLRQQTIEKLNQETGLPFTLAMLLDDVRAVRERGAWDIDRYIKSLEEEIADTFKKSYAANLIRLDVAKLQKDIHILATGIQEILESYQKFDKVLELMDNLSNEMQLTLRISTALAHQVDEVKRKVDGKASFPT